MVGMDTSMRVEAKRSDMLNCWATQTYQVDTKELERAARLSLVTTWQIVNLKP